MAPWAGIGPSQGLYLRTPTYILNSQNFKSLKLALIVCLVFKCTSLKQAPTTHSVRHVVFQTNWIKFGEYYIWDVTPCSPIKVPMFRMNVVSSSSGSRSNLRSQKEPFSKLNSYLCLARPSLSISAILRMEVVLFFESVMKFPALTTWYHMPQDSPCHSDRCEDIGSSTS